MLVSRLFLERGNALCRLIAWYGMVEVRRWLCAALSVSQGQKPRVVDFKMGAFVVQWRKCVVQELVIDECQLTGCISVCGCSLECDIGIYVEL